MNQTLSAAPCCPACGSPALVKNGHNACGTQPYLCKACGARQVLAPKTRPATAERQEEILRAVATERLSLRAAERVFGVARQTVAKWLERSRSSPAAERHAVAR